MTQRGKQGLQVQENNLQVLDSDTVLMMQRGSEGFFVINKALAAFDTPSLDLTLTDLEGCYNELRNNFTVAIQRNGAGKKFVTRWGTNARGGLQVQGRDAL